MYVLERKNNLVYFWSSWSYHLPPVSQDCRCRSTRGVHWTHRCGPVSRLGTCDSCPTSSSCSSWSAWPQQWTGTRLPAYFRSGTVLVTYLIMLIQLIPVPDLSLDLNSRRPVLWSRSREKDGSSTADFTLPYLLFTKCYEIQYHLTKTHISQHADYTKR